jgi:uncharacterized protein (TIGR00295 family)
MPGLPSPDECRRLFRETGLGADVIEHVEAVARLGKDVANALKRRGHAVDVGLVEAGCLLHDIGRSESHGLDHATKGAALLRSRGYPEALCLCVERHTCGGSDPQDAARLGLPVRDYTPRTIEEKLVCHIDNLFDGAERQLVGRELDWLGSKGLPEVAAKIQKLHSDLSHLLGTDLDMFP